MLVLSFLIPNNLGEFNQYLASKPRGVLKNINFQGAAKIMEKIASLTFQKIAHLITAVDCQPMFDGGILINVLGQLKVKV